MTTGCFTGIESTPKINDNDLRREHVVVTDEMRFLADVEGEPLGRWAEGKPLRVTDSKINLVLSPHTVKDFKGADMRYMGIDSAVNVSGGMKTLVRLKAPDGEMFTYAVDAPPSDMRNRGEGCVPFTIDLELVKRVASIMKGRQFYTLSRLWCDSVGNKVTGRKFVPVTVTDVIPGNDTYPAIVLFDDENGKSGAILMSIGHDRRSTRRFENIFSLTDPRKRYPSITKEHWDMIILGKVTRDMTKDECRLSLGEPALIDRLPTYGGVVERWTYDDGCYLIFHDGLLQEFRQ